MEENIFCEDEEENRSAKSYGRWVKDLRYDVDDREGGFGSPDSFDAIWEGRS